MEFLMWKAGKEIGGITENCSPYQLSYSLPSESSAGKNQVYLQACHLLEEGGEEADMSVGVPCPCEQ